MEVFKQSIFGASIILSLVSVLTGFQYFSVCTIQCHNAKVRPEFRTERIEKVESIFRNTTFIDTGLVLAMFSLEAR